MNEIEDRAPNENSCSKPADNPASFGECHAHVAMDGINYAKAMALHKDAPDESHIRRCFKTYKHTGVNFVRDGGDKYGVSALAKRIAPEYGIDYRTPLFAIHKRGHYGSIVGRAFDDMHGYAQLVAEAKAQGADFIKIMTTGIMDFNEYCRITHADLEAYEVREMVHIAHESGLAVMSHTNGARAALIAIEAGVDSIEHGNYIDDECIAALAESRTCFVPTATVARNLIVHGLFDETVLNRIWETSRSTIAKAAAAGCLLAQGSDAGAVGVPHGQGTLDEYSCFQAAIPNEAMRNQALQQGMRYISETFSPVGPYS